MQHRPYAIAALLVLVAGIVMPAGPAAHAAVIGGVRHAERGGHSSYGPPPPPDKDDHYSDSECSDGDCQHNLVCYLLNGSFAFCKKVKAKKTDPKHSAHAERESLSG